MTQQSCLEFDVVIVGAGLAGCTAAWTIASHSRARIGLVERRGIGSNNPTPLTFTDVLGSYQLEDCAIGYYRQFTFHSPLGNRSSHVFDGQPLVALDYRNACEKLVRNARRSENLTLLITTASGLIFQGRKWKISLTDGRQLQTPLVIDASGRGLFSSRALNLPRPKEFSHCYGARFSHCPVPDPQEVFFFAPSIAYGNGGGWLYPLDGERVSFGFASLGRSPTLPAGDLKVNLRRAVSDFKPYADWLEGAALDYIEAGSIPIYPLRRFVYDSLLIVGDAAGQATIWSCMGSATALEAGQLAGEAALAGFIKNDFSAALLQQYQKQWDKRNREIYRRNAWIAPTVWSQSEASWNRQIPLLKQLTPDQMVERLRINWPVPSVLQAIFIRVVDLAGRIRRGMLRQLRKWWGMTHYSRAVE